MAKVEKPPIPGWAWIFAVICVAMPVASLGGAIPGAVGFASAAGCVAIARDTRKSEGLRIAICLAIAAVCWLVFVLLIALFAGSRHA